MSLKQKLYEKVKKQPYGTEDVVDIDSIIIPDYMKNPLLTNGNYKEQMIFYKNMVT